MMAARDVTFTEQDIESLVDLSGGIDLCEKNGIDYDDLVNISQIKTRLLATLHGAKSAGDRTLLLEKFATFTLRDAELQRLLCTVYTELIQFFSLVECTEDVVELINKAVNNCEGQVRQNYKLLRDNGCPVLVAGESGAGKSSFLNLLIRSDINPVDHSLSATSAICELHNSNRIADAQIAYGPDHPDFNKGTDQEVVRLNPECPEEAQRELAQYTISSQRTRRMYDLVKIRWPIPMLQGRVFLVDSPGVGENDPMTERVLSYLPKAVAFIYIINCGINGGGISEQRLEVVLNPVTALKHDEDLQRFNPKCAIFIFNKWDEVKGEEVRRKLLENNIKKLKVLWPGIDEEKQIYCLSVKRAQAELRIGGGETEEYKKLLDGLYEFMETGLLLSIENHQRWLYYVHGRLLNIVQTNFTNAKRTKTQKARVARDTRGKLEQLQQEADKVILDLEEKLEEEMKNIAAAIIEHFMLKETVASLAEECNMLDLECEVEEDMELNKKRTMETIKKVVTLEVPLWEEKKKLIEKAKNKLIADFKKSFNKVGGMLRDIESEMQGMSSALNNAAPLFIGDSTGTAAQQMTFSEKLVIGLAAPVWLPLAVVTLTIALPILVTWTVYDKVKHHQKLEQYKKDRKPFVLEWTWEAVKSLTAGTIKEQVVKKRMMQIKDQLEQFKAQIPQIVEADLALMEKVEGEIRAQAEIEQQYSPLLRQLKTSYGKLLYIKLRYLQHDEPDFYPESDVKMKEELGEGTFGKVHAVSVVPRPKDGREDDKPMKVAAKVMKERLTAETAIGYTQERDILSSLTHENIVKYIGISIDKDDQFILLTELCDCTLRDLIFGRKVPVPGKVEDQEKFVEAFKAMVDRSRQITKGLAYIHSKNYVHRDVNMSNILVTGTDYGVLKLSDMGQAKPESAVTTTRRGTRFYRDPEVLRGGLATQEADIYSLAIIMYELWFGFIIYSDVFSDQLTDFETIEAEIQQGDRKPNLDVRHYRRPIQEWCQLLEDCWKDTPKDRKSSQEIYEELGGMLLVEFINTKVQPVVTEEVDRSMHVENRQQEYSYW